MIELIQCTEDIWRIAEERTHTLPIYPGSHRESEANEVGVLGEVAAEHWMKNYGLAFKDERHCTTHDYRISRTGRTIDVKTKDRTVAPRPYYECSVPLYNHSHQRPDYYLFVSLLRDRDTRRLSKDIRRFTHAYILGAITPNRIDEIGTIWNAGSVDPSNGTTFWTACMNVRVEQLVEPARAIAYWARETP